jgi:hypothetical protein
MPEYEVALYYTGFITRTVEAENEEEAIRKARTEQDAPLRQSAFVKSFELIFETLEPWKECDTAELKKKSVGNQGERESEKIITCHG